MAAILRGEKTATSSLLLEYELESDDHLPEIGSRSVVVDSSESPVCVIEATEVRVLPLHAIDEQFARDEGEGFQSAAEWRTAHEAFWKSAEMRAALGLSQLAVDNETLVVAERFRLIERLD